MKEKQAIYIADLITDIVKHREEALDRVREAVIELCREFPLYENDIL